MVSEGLEGLGLGGLLPGVHLFHTHSRKPKFSPLHLHTHEVNVQGDDMCMAGPLQQSIQVIKRRAGLEYCYGITY